jgi:hypothetical protein
MADLVFVDPGAEHVSIACPLCLREDARPGAGGAAAMLEADLPLDRDWAEATCPRGHAIRLVREGSEGGRH